MLVIFALTEGKADGGVHVHVVQTVARKRTLQLDSSSRHDNMNNDQQQGGSSYNNADDGNMNGGVQYSTNPPLLNEGYYYEGAGANGTTAISFDSYIVTTVNPGNQLLLLTLGICLCCFIIGYLALPGKCMNRLFYQRFKRTKGKVEEHGDDSVELKEPPLCKDGASRENEDPSCYDQEMGANEYITDLAEEKANRLHVPSRGDDDNFEDNPKVTEEENDMNKRVWKETMKIIGLGTLIYQRFKITKGKVEEHGDDSVELKEPPLCKDGASRENEDPSCYDQEMGANEYITDLAEEKANRLHVPSRGDDDNFEDNPKVTEEENDMNKRVWKETMKIIGLGTP